MKVSILTYHWEDNYGATMQAYATYRAVKESGHTPEFIDLRLPYAPSLKSRLVFGLKRYRFNSFRKKHFRNLTDKTYRSVEELRRNPPASDCYLVGSDQTWNPQIGKKLLPAFFLTFGDDSVRRVTYATSIGLNQWEKSPYISDSEIKKSLGRFHRILLREDSGIRIARETFGVEARQVVDPVLLFHSYPELTGKIRPSGEVITYKLINDEGFYDKARAVADTMHLPVRSIGSVRKTQRLSRILSRICGGMDPQDCWRFARADRLVSWNGNLAALSPAVRGIYRKSEQNNTYCVATRPTWTVRTNPHRRKHHRENPRHRKQENRLERSRQEAFQSESRLTETIGRNSELGIARASCDTVFRHNCRGCKPARTEWGLINSLHFSLTHYENIDGQHCSY